MPTSEQILSMLNQLEERGAPYRSLDGGNYTNDHTLMGINEALKKIELFIDFGGEIKLINNQIKVAWSSHSSGELEVFRVGENEFFVHGEIYTG